MKKKLIIGVYHPSVILTYLGLASAVSALLTLYRGRVVLSLLFLVIAGVCDMFDGVIARAFKRTPTEKDFGVQIDSLVDIVSFVICPVCLLFSQAGCNFVTAIVAIVYAICGVERLAWFNITTEENKGYFIGLPVTYAALIFPLLYIGLFYLPLSDSIRALIWMGVFLLIALLFVLNFKLKKPSLVFRLAMVVVAIGLIAMLVIML